MKKKIIGGVLGISLLVPFVTFAQTTLTDVNSINVFIGTFVNMAIGVLITVAVLIFVWGAFQWLSAGADEEKKSAGKSRMINGVIGIFLMISVWGIINIILNTIGTNTAVNQAAVDVNRNVAIPTI